MIASTITKPLMLIGMILVLLVTWIVLLPLLGETTIVRQWIEPLRDQGINPSGMYYTDVFE
jgi:hypothetical protein